MNISDNPTRDDFERLMIFQSQVESARRRSAPPPQSIGELEYALFSQFGDDGIIQYLASKIPAEHQTFVEFGVEDYRESNTRLLLQRDNWRGLVLDGSADNVEKIRAAPYFWRHDLQAEHAFITRDNINELIEQSGFSGTLGILHVDIDGVDYWIWEAIKVVKPLVVICEYNSVFGADAPVSIPYSPDFYRMDKHHSGLYAGASIAALVHLGNENGLDFIGTNAAGNNAYFADPILNIGLPVQTASSGYVRSKFREARATDGTLLMKTAHGCIDSISHLPVVDVTCGREFPLHEALRTKT